MAPAPSDIDTSSGSFFTGFTQRSQLLSDMGGVRTMLSGYGISLGLSETSEVLGNATGGIHQGADYDGLTTMSLGLDTQRAFGWEGGIFNISALQIHGRNLGSDNLGTLLPPSGINADRTTRLWELWYQQSFLDGQVDVKLGQQSLDQEFIVSTNALLFVNTAFGWPLVPSVDMPGGGPAYPLSSLGVRVRAQISPQFTALLGLFNGSPTARFNTEDSQIRNGSGTSFPLNGGALVIGELQFAFPGNGSMVAPGGSGPLPGSYKIGFWWDSEPFADQNLDNTGVSLASLVSNGTPLQRNGDYSIYAVMDQSILQIGDDSGRLLNVFARVMGAPDDRNLINFGANLGLVLHEPIVGRGQDTAGIAMGYGRVGKSASDFDKEAQRVTGSGFRRTAETFIELTYQAQVTNWMQLQPDFQYVWNPGAGVANPNDPTQKLKNEAIFGLRTNITF
ncbi:MAG: carbohydrate porin [Acetobacteraceae bacterium]